MPPVTPHAGVWIETYLILSHTNSKKSLPMRECGLKRDRKKRPYSQHFVTPHAGVWIETSSTRNTNKTNLVTPHAGVWIETGQ